MVAHFIRRRLLGPIFSTVGARDALAVVSRVRECNGHEPACASSGLARFSQLSKFLQRLFLVSPNQAGVNPCYFPTILRRPACNRQKTEQLFHSYKSSCARASHGDDDTEQNKIQKRVVRHTSMISKKN